MRIDTIKAAFLKEFPFFMALPSFLWQFLFFYFPLLFIVYMSFVKGWGLWGSLSLEHYRLLVDPLYMKVIGRSLLLALVTAFVCLILAYPLAYFLAFKIRRGKNLFLFFLILPFWTNLLIQMYAWFFVLEKNGLINTLLMRTGIINEPIQLLHTSFSIYLVMIYCYVPFMIMPLYSILDKLNVRLIEASLDLGASQLQTFIRVIIPLSMSGILTGFFLVFIPAFGEFVIPAFLGGAKQFFVGSLIAHYLLVVRDPFLGSAFTCLSSLVLITVALLFHWYVKRSIGIVQEIRSK